MPKINDIKGNLSNLKQTIDKFKIETEKIIGIINEMNNNLNKYYQICDYIINNNIEVKNRNYSTLYNIKAVTNNNFQAIKELETIINEKDISVKFKKIMKLKNKMEILNNSKEGNNDITIVYNINKGEDKVKIFGSNFVKNNINNCKIIYQNREYELKEYFEDFSKSDSKLQIKLTEINNIQDTSYMFYECTSLISLPDIEKWNTEFITSMRCMFFGCSSNN
jgi:surface protein